LQRYNCDNFVRAAEIVPAGLYPELGDDAPLSGGYSIMNNNYPFLTKAAIKDRLAVDSEFVLQCVLVMDARQTEDEQESRETKWRNRRGWMSSHAVHGGRIAALVRSGEELSAEDADRARGMVLRYSKQLAAHFRQAAQEEDPSLAEAGSVFGV
jgi:hypothetical protein